MYDSTILHLYSVLYVYHPQLSLLPSSFSPFTLFQFPLPPFPSGDHHTVVLSLRSFFFLRFYLQKKKDFIYFFLESEEGREKERERNIKVWLPLICPQLGTWPITQACALTGNQTSDPLVCRQALNPLSHTSQGEYIFFSLNPFTFFS